MTMGITMKRQIGILLISFFLFLYLIVPLTPVAAAPVGTETRISFSSGSTCINTWPSSDNGWIAWEEECGGVSSIIVYNYNTGIQTTLPKTHLSAHSPAVRGNRVVYYENEGLGTPADIYYSDLTSLPLTAHPINVPPSTKYHPVVDGDHIAWQNMNPSDSTFDILLYNIPSSTLYNLTPDTLTSNQIYPSIFGSRVAWLDNRAGEKEIYFNDTSDWSLHSIPVITPGIGYNQPEIYQNSLVWYDDTPEIFLSDLIATTPITSDGNPKLTPAVCSTFIVWKESSDSGATWDIAFYDTGIPGTEMITNTQSVEPDPDTAPVIITPDSRIIWVDNRPSFLSNIFMFSNGVSTTCPVVQYTVDTTEGNAPLTVRFSDTSTNSPAYWYWDFGDGSTATTQDVTHTFASNGIFPVNLTVGTPYCRNRTIDTRVTSISVGVPSVDFSANSTQDIAPFPVAFTGTGTNVPTSWAWTFGDGGTAVVQNPVYTYNDPGTYAVTLVATNAVGAGTKTRTAYITALNGTVETASLPIPGISVAGTPQNLTLDKGLVPSFSLSGDKKTLSAYPPALYGWQNITFLSSNAAGFNEDASTIYGTFSTVFFLTKDISPTTFSPRVGDNLKINYLMQPGRYDNTGSLKTQVWESTSPSDNPIFDDIMHFGGFTSKDVAYTLTVTRSGFSTPLNERINMSTGSDWVTGSSDIAFERLHTFVIANGYNSQGDFVGTILPVTFAGNDTINHIEYFNMDVPSQYSYLNKFALAKLSGSGNPLQLITLTVASHISQLSDSPGNDDAPHAGAGAGKGTAPATVQNVNPPKAFVPPDPGKTEKIYANANGVITQPTLLESTDHHAQISLGLGVVAKDRKGAPLSSVTLTALAAESLPSAPSPASFTFAGMAYNFEPEGATFSPAISLSFNYPQATWGQEYSVKEFDPQSGTWQDLPTTHDPNTGMITAQISRFCCIALFAKPLASANPAPKAISPVKTQAPPPVTPAPPPGTALNIFMGMMTWIADLVIKNVYIFVIVVVLGVAYVIKKRKYPGSGL